VTQKDNLNRQWILVKRPVGEPDSSTLRLIESAPPEAGASQMLLRTEFLSLDPYMRGRMSDAPSYAPSVEIGGVMVGSTIARVMTSAVEGFVPGDWVLSLNGWQDYTLSDGTGVINLGATPEHPSWALGVLGMPGLTAYAGLTEIGQPKSGETIVVAAATGPVGSTVGQIGKILGCHVVGIVGGPDKCAYAVKTLGFDACVDHKRDDLAALLAKACPKGIDVYFENVGGKVLDAVLPLLNSAARVPLCGLVSQYNATALPEGPDRTNALLGLILRKRLTVRGFIVFQDFSPLYPQFIETVGAWVAEGKIRYVEDIVDGLENASSAFVGLLRGDNLGKRVIRVGV
jgi:NADPH-dependent curcumin reductase CurA